MNHSKKVQYLGFFFWAMVNILGAAGAAGAATWVTLKMFEATQEEQSTDFHLIEGSCYTHQI